MGKKIIYIVESSKGEYEVSFNNEKAFNLKYDAAIYQEKADKVFKRLSKFYTEKYHINVGNQSDEFFTYWEKMEKYSNVGFYIAELELI